MAVRSIADAGHSWLARIPAEEPELIEGPRRTLTTSIAVGMVLWFLLIEVRSGDAGHPLRINNLFSKIGARDRAQAVAYAFRHGLEPE